MGCSAELPLDHKLLSLSGVVSTVNNFSASPPQNCYTNLYQFGMKLSCIGDPIVDLIGL